MLKRTLLALTLIVALAGSSASAGWAMLEQVAVAGTAIGFTAANIKQGAGHPQANIAVCRVRTAQISARWDGGTPTSTVGTLFEVGDVFTLNAPWQLVNFLAIRTTGTSGQADCTLSED